MQASATREDRVRRSILSRITASAASRIFNFANYTNKELTEHEKWHSKHDKEAKAKVLQSFEGLTRQ